ncbi:unnamed protein product [Rhodiola kirilowii]
MSFTIFTPSNSPCRVPFFSHHPRRPLPHRFSNTNRNPNFNFTSDSSSPNFSTSTTTAAACLPLRRTISDVLKHSAPPVLLFLALFTSRASAAPPVAVPVHQQVIQVNVEHDEESIGVDRSELTDDQDQNLDTIDSSQEDKVLNAEFERWKSKTFALLVPLRIVALQGSVPPSWLKEFIQSQGKRLRLRSEFRGSLENIYKELSKSLTSRKVDTKSAIAADAVSMGDSWLTLAIRESIIDPMDEDQDWFKHLSDKWKIFLRRNSEGAIDSEGKIWAAPYRWGTMVIAYKKTKFQKHNLKPIEDWDDLWQPSLQGRISMVGCPREVVGAVLKHMGMSYNTDNMELQVSGGRNAVLENLRLLRKQVRLFDSTNYLKAFGVGDVWVAVGWSSDILPAAKRMSNVVVIVPNSGASLWADLWTIPAASKLPTTQIGGRIRGPSPLTSQWIEFCLQPARASPFKKEVVPGASPSALDCSTPDVPLELKGKPKLETNLIGGVPPPDILSKCEFLEPLSDTALSDHKWLISQVQKPDNNNNIIQRLQQSLFSGIQAFKSKLRGKVA